MGAGWRGIGVGLLLLTGCGSSAARDPDTFCADALTRVQAYQAPGQGRPLEQQVGANLPRVAAGRSYQVGAWRAEPRPSTADFCTVVYTATIGNMPAQYLWWYTPKSGKVDAADDATRQLSGW